MAEVVDFPYVSPSRDIAWDRATTPCHYCGGLGSNVNPMTLDHIIPRSNGGQDAPFNIVPSCMKCNTDKSSKMPTCTCSKCAWAVTVWNQQKQDRPWRKKDQF